MVYSFAITCILQINIKKNKQQQQQQQKTKKTNKQTKKKQQTNKQKQKPVITPTKNAQYLQSSWLWYLR